MTIRDYPLDIARAIGFLSRIPIPGFVFKDHDGKLDRVSAVFPVAGLVIGAMPALLFGLLCACHADPLLAAILVIALQTLITGALHEDGLTDTADGLGAGRNKTRALEIMKDSRIGTYGAIALVLSFALRAAALAAIAKGVTPIPAGVSILATSALTRSAIVWHWYMLPPAKSDGVAAAAGRPGEPATQLALVSAALIAAALLWPAMSLHALVFCLLAVAAVTFAFTAWIRKRLNGHTGDTLGATQQLAEIAALCALALAA